MLTEPTEYNPPRSTSHHEFASFVCEKVVESPSIALDASKLAPDPDTNVVDWAATLPAAVLTPSKSRTCTSNI
jgi:hypothetical protein